MNIVKSLKIEITQADVEKAIIDLIAKEDPTIVVDAITFSAKRGGDETIAVNIEAHFNTEDITPVPVGLVPRSETKEEPPFEPDPVEESDEEEEEEQPEVTPKTSLFG